MLILVRHGESTGNADGLLLGRIDAPLTAQGAAQARAVGRVLSGVSRLISSPLDRAHRTAEALGTGLAVEVDDRWIEVDYGEYDGRPLRAVPEEVWARWRSDPDFRPPGGETLARGGHQGPVGLRGVVRGGRTGSPRARCRRGGQPRVADQGGHVLGVGARRPRCVAPLSGHRLGDPDQLGSNGPVLAQFNETPWSDPA